MKTPADGWDREEQETLRELEAPLDELRERHHADPPIEVLQAARSGVLPEELQERLADSGWNRALIDGLRYEEAELDRDAEDRVLARIQTGAKELPRRHSFWTWLSRPAFAAAAAVIILIAAALAWRSGSLRTQETAPPQPTVVTATPPPAPAFHLPLEAPKVRLSVAVLTWRGTDEKNHLLADLKPGLDAFRQGDYATADAELSKIAAAYPDSFEVRYYQGVSRLFVDDIPGAIDSLTAAQRRADSSFAPDAAWYLAVAYQRARRIEDARKELSRVCNAGAARAAEACAALQQIR